VPMGKCHAAHYGPQNPPERCLRSYVGIIQAEATRGPQLPDNRSPGSTMGGYIAGLRKHALDLSGHAVLRYTRPEVLRIVRHLPSWGGCFDPSSSHSVASDCFLSKIGCSDCGQEYPQLARTGQFM